MSWSEELGEAGSDEMKMEGRRLHLILEQVSQLNYSLPCLQIH